MSATGGEQVYATVCVQCYVRGARTKESAANEPIRNLVASAQRFVSPRYFLAFQFLVIPVANSLSGALVLAHSLRDACTTKKLAVLVTLDSVSAESITQLRVRPPPPPLSPSRTEHRKFNC